MNNDNYREIFTIRWRQTYDTWSNELADPIELALLDGDYSEALAVIEQVKNLK